MPTVITAVDTLPSSPYNGTGIVSLVIATGIPNYFKVSGSELDRIKSVDWYPKNPASVVFTIRPLILVNDSLATFMIMVKNNYLDDSDRSGKLTFKTITGEQIHFPVKTYGPVSAGPLWTAPEAGLTTG